MPDATVERLEAAAFTVPTDAPESDGTLAWDATTMVVVEVHGGGQAGLGYTYGPPALTVLVRDVLEDVAVGADALDPQRVWWAARAALRNAGQAGMGALAVSALDLALHDLRARLLGLPLARALGAVQREVPVYGSGGFTSYGLQRLAEQLAGWAEEGLGRVKMKVGRDPAADPARLDAARAAVGDDVGLMVDANGAFAVRDAVRWAHRYAGWGVDWLEEPVSSDDVDGLRAVREQGPPGVAVAAGEYVWSPLDARRLLEHRSVDVLQADVTRCGGLTGAMHVDALAAAHGVPLSLHCAPAMSAHVGCQLATLKDLERFHDHVRVERLLLDGVPELRDGALRPDLGRPGHGMSLRRADAERHRARS